MMKVLFINGSPHEKGNTYIALQEMDKIFAAEKIDTEIVHIGNKDIRGCIACRLCAKNGKCVFDDAVNAVAPKFEACDGLVVGKPRLLCVRKRNAGRLPDPVVLQYAF